VTDETAAQRASAALARLYDLDLSEDPGDVDLYLALAARTGGPILELAAGTGRLAIELARAGHQVTGIDIDPAMLQRADGHQGDVGGQWRHRIRFLEGDARTIRLPDAGSYRLAFIGLNSIFLMGTRSDQAAAIATLAAHLAPGGLAVVDAWLPDAEDLARYDGRLVLEWVREDPASGRVVTKTGSAIYDPAGGLVRLTTVFEEGLPGEPTARWVRVDRLRLAGPDDLLAMAETAGLEVDTLAGGYELEPMGPGSERAIMVARHP